MDFIGEKLRLEIFGASHAREIGMRLDGFPAGERVDRGALAAFLARRAPGRGDWTTPRREDDAVLFHSGVTEEMSDGSPVVAVIENTDVRPRDYAAHASVPRPGHADYTAWVRSGEIPSGGGAFSGRMTAPLCIAGGLCLQALERRGIRVAARAAEIAGIADEGELTAEARIAGFPTLSPRRGEEMKAAIAAAKAEGDSVGGIVECAVFSLPAGIGGPLFEGLEGRLAAALFAIPAVKGVEFGAGFSAARLRGSENNDPFVLRAGRVETATNNCGGLLGGITDGMPLRLRVAFKPTPSIAKEQRSVDLEKREETTLTVAGRHDPCVVPRAVPCVEAAAALVLFDALLAFEQAGKDLPALRARLDDIDRELLALFERRMAVCGEVAEYKKEKGLAILDAGREEQKLGAIREACAPELRDEAESLFREIMALSRRRQRELTGRSTDE